MYVDPYTHHPIDNVVSAILALASLIVIFWPWLRRKIKR